MAPMNPNWHNVSRNDPCPICHKPDWCSVANDGRVCVCRRIESAHPTKSGYGWIHSLENQNAIPLGVSRAATACRQHNFTTPDFAALHGTFSNDRAALARFAAELGVSTDALAALDVRHWPAKNCLSFPMRDLTGRITGLRYRHVATGRKWSAKGSHDGLFYATLPTENLVITEGPTDTAAALSLGLNAVGRSSCLAGTELLVKLVRSRGFPSVTIIADGDAPGWNGAKRLAAALPVPARLILPPPGIKDLRSWT